MARGQPPLNPQYEWSPKQPSFSSSSSCTGSPIPPRRIPSTGESHTHSCKFPFLGAHARRRMEPGTSHLPLPSYHPLHCSEASDSLAPFLVSDELRFLFPELTVPEESEFFGEGGALMSKPLVNGTGLEYRGLGGSGVFPFDGAAISVEDLEFIEAGQLGFKLDGTAGGRDPVRVGNLQDAGFDRLVEQCPAPGVATRETRPQTDIVDAPVSGEEARPEIATVPVDLIQNRRPFRCSHAGCDKAFKNPQTLKMHHRSHYRELGDLPGGNPAKAGQNKKIPCRCPVCLRTFVGLYELRRHYGRKHTGGEKAHGCGKCGKRFYVEADVKDHEKLCGALVGCKCGLKFAFKCNLSAHKRTHPECLEEQPAAAANPHHSRKSGAAVSCRRSDSRVGNI